MTLFYRTPDGSMDALLFLMNDAIGLKDVVCMYGDGAEIEDNIREQSDIMILAPCTLELARDAAQADAEKLALALPTVVAAMGGKPARKVIVVPNRVINVVV